jgi:hypothetical protein
MWREVEMVDDRMRVEGLKRRKTVLMGELMFGPRTKAKRVGEGESANETKRGRGEGAGWLTETVPCWACDTLTWEILQAWPDACGGPPFCQHLGGWRGPY